MVRYYICVHIDTTRKIKFTRTYRYNMDTGIYVLIDLGYRRAITKYVRECTQINIQLRKRVSGILKVAIVETVGF